ncbi:hypothetical protein E2542_SST16286 [Spatholobus suberectus]|nr:hypothetical protein E2542_SST16286 [Spatholobus suberectus]
MLLTNLFPIVRFLSALLLTNQLPFHSIDKPNLSKFEFVASINDAIRGMLKTELNEKWRQWKSDLKTMAYNPSKKEKEVASALPDDKVEPSQYCDLVHYWFFELGQKVSEINRKNIAKFEDVHCMGTKSLPKLIDEKAPNASSALDHLSSSSSNANEDN